MSASSSAAATPSPIEDTSIIFYDIKCNEAGTTWSHNTWKTRIVLNYKRIPYRTEWLSLPEIEPTLRGLGFRPLQVKFPPLPYTLPAIIDPSRQSPTNPRGALIMDSFAIAEYLDDVYPDRPVFPPGTKGLQAMFLRYFEQNIGRAAIPLALSGVPDILDDAGAEYYRRTRAAWLGMPIDTFRPQGEALEAAWRKLQHQMDVLSIILDKNGANPAAEPFVMGDQPSFADFVLCGYFDLLMKVDGGVGWERIRKWNKGRWARIWERCKEYMY
ncbi:hypothetical protein BOTBODRAFT_31223 [Botryobasidium botryosum FD-172 SS1]|uniref:GST N-terminal domain-containing protein n=1 Tax=Botryobasidium botryosum (strain FD-172 SS1) TaxID=930990 RepID=A0A067MN57_BOTB1|nr:hypothetical protein BOTBODRAFT_31223 [Botryobasidium botryosum FD-172 SS1]